MQNNEIVHFSYPLLIMALWISSTILDSIFYSSNKHMSETLQASREAVALEWASYLKGRSCAHESGAGRAGKEP